MEEVRFEKTISDVTSSIEADYQICIKRLGSPHGISDVPFVPILHRNIGLVKKSAKDDPTVVAGADGEESGDSAALGKMVTEKGRSSLGNNINIVESAVSLHTTETKNQSKKWLEKGKPCFTKKKVQASGTKQVVLAFYQNKGWCMITKYSEAPQ
jgi:hypothetical protein